VAIVPFWGFKIFSIRKPLKIGNLEIQNMFDFEITLTLLENTLNKCKSFKSL
jgi:hypothetical protein